MRTSASSVLSLTISQVSLIKCGFCLHAVNVEEWETEWWLRQQKEGTLKLCLEKWIWHKEESIKGKELTVRAVYTTKWGKIHTWESPNFSISTKFCFFYFSLNNLVRFLIYPLPYHKYNKARVYIYTCNTGRHTHTHIYTTTTASKITWLSLSLKLTLL